MELRDDLLVKYNCLIDYLQKLGSLAVAFSSGVDSTFLLYASKKALGDKVCAVTATSCSFPARELEESLAYCKELGVKHFLVKSEELNIDGFRQNPKNRCYLCKKELFTHVKEVAAEQGMQFVAEGSNTDDIGDYRPGLIAIRELGVKSPLRHCNLSKQDIRDLSQYFELPTWKKQSFACLASRFPYGELISEEKLGMVDKAEQLLLDMGFNQLRVRIHGKIARIELDENDFDRFMNRETREKVYKELKSYGFSYVALDIMGYRTGSMNEVLADSEKDAVAKQY